MLPETSDTVMTTRGSSVAINKAYLILINVLDGVALRGALPATS